VAEHAAVPVTDEAIRAALAADNRWAADTRPTAWETLSDARVRNLLEAAAPFIAAGTQERYADVLAMLSAKEDQ